MANTGRHRGQLPPELGAGRKEPDLSGDPGKTHSEAGRVGEAGPVGEAGRGGEAGRRGAGPVGEAERGREAERGGEARFYRAVCPSQFIFTF